MRITIIICSVVLIVGLCLFFFCRKKKEKCGCHEEKHEVEEKPKEEIVVVETVVPDLNSVRDKIMEEIKEIEIKTIAVQTSISNNITSTDQLKESIRTLSPMDTAYKTLKDKSDLLAIDSIALNKELAELKKILSEKKDILINTIDAILKKGKL